MKKTLAALAILLTCSSAFAIMGFLQSEQVNGSVKYCKYSNGVIVTVQSYELCPLSVN